MPDDKTRASHSGSGLGKEEGAQTLEGTGGSVQERAHLERPDHSRTDHGTVPCGVEGRSVAGTKVELSARVTYLYDKNGNRVLHALPKDFARAYRMTRQNVWYWVKRGMPAVRITKKLYMIPWRRARDWVWAKFQMWPKIELAQKR